MANPNDPEIHKSVAQQGGIYPRLWALGVSEFLAWGQFKVALSFPDASISETAQHVSVGVGFTAISAVLLSGAIEISKRNKTEHI